MTASFSNDVISIQNALIALCEAFTDPNGGTVTASNQMSKYGLGDSELPYIWVKRGRMLTRDERTTDLYEDTRQYQVLIYVSRLVDNEQDDESEFDNAVNWIKPFHKYLAQNRLLTPIGEIVLSDVRDSSDVNLFSKDAKRYVGIVFTIPIKTPTRF